jgi:hypothetical protein
MDVVNFGHFTVSASDDGIIYYANEDGMDWYEMRKGLTNWTLDRGQFVDAVFGAWATVDPDGVIINVEFNPSNLVPDNRTVLGIDAHWEEIWPGWTYRDGELKEGPMLQWLKDYLGATT